jgi:ribonuclease Z
MPQPFDIVFLGTGSPLPSPDRCGCGHVIVAAGQHILVDCGWGAARRILASGIMPSAIDTAVFTHMHTDHITDFPDFLFLRWTSGARVPLRVYGPEGTGEMVEGFLHALRRDIGFRLAHHGDKLHPDGIVVEVTEISPSARPAPFFERDGLVLERFEVDHFPVVPAFGYRARFDGRTAVLSGDTSFCESLLHAAEGADMLVCEALNTPMLNERIAALRAIGRDLQASLFEDVPSYHIDVSDVARLAQQAGVRQLVLNHLIPPVPNSGPELDRFIAGMTERFRGPIRVARDTERIPVPGAPA